MNKDVFISYSSKDEVVARKLVDFLESKNVPCFISSRDIPAGAVWASVLTDALESSKLLVAVYSNNFNLSKQVDREIEIMIEDRKPVLLYKITEDSFSSIKTRLFNGVEAIDSTAKSEEHFDDLLLSIEKLIGIRTSMKPVRVQVKTDVDSIVYIDDNQKLQLKANETGELELLTGQYIITITSKAYKNIYYEKLLNVQNPDEEYMVEALLKAAVEDQCLLKYETSSLFGFADDEGTIIMQPKYEDVQYFSDELAAVKKDGKWGFIDKEENTVIDFRYDKVGFFFMDRAVACIQNKWGVIDRQGNEMVPFTYDSTKYLDNGTILLVNGDLITSYNSKDNSIKETNDTIAALTDNTKKGVFPYKYKNTYGFKTNQNEIIIPPYYSDWKPYFKVEDDSSAKYSRYGDNPPITGSVIIVSIGGKQGIINVKGEEIVSPKYDKIDDKIDSKLGSGYEVCRVVDDMLHGYFNILTGIEVCPPKYDYGETHFAHGLCIVQIDAKFGCINTDCKEIIPLQYDVVEEPDNDGLRRVALNNKWGIIDKHGKPVVRVEYDYAGYFRDDLCVVEKDNKAGAIDYNENIIIPLQYESLSDFNSGVAIVTHQGKEGILNKENNVVALIQYDSHAERFSEGFLTVEKDGKCGFIDTTGKEIIPLTYDSIGDFFYKGFIAVRKNRKWGLINTKGLEVTEFKYDQIDNDKTGNAYIGDTRLQLVISDKDGSIIEKHYY